MNTVKRFCQLIAFLTLLEWPVRGFSQNWIPSAETEFDFRTIKKIQAGPPGHVYALDRKQNIALIRFDTLKAGGRTEFMPVLVNSIPLSYWPGFRNEHRVFDFSSVSEDGRELALSLISKKITGWNPDGSPVYLAARQELFVIAFPEQRLVFRTETEKKPASAFHGQTLRYTDYSNGSLRLMAKDPEDPKPRMYAIPAGEGQNKVIRPVNHLSIGNQGLSATEKIKICFDANLLDFFLEADTFRIEKEGRALRSLHLRPESDVEIFRFRKYFLLSIQPADSFFLVNPASGFASPLPKPLIKLHQQTGFMDDALLVNFSKGCFSFFDIRTGKTTQSKPVPHSPALPSESPRLAVSGSDRVICWQKTGQLYRFNLRSRQFGMEKSGNTENSLLHFPNLNSKKFRLKSTRFSELEGTSNLASSSFAPGIFLNGVRIGRSGISSVDEFVKLDVSEKAGLAFLHYQHNNLMAMSDRAEKVWEVNEIDSPLRAIKADEEGNSVFTISASGVVEFRKAGNGKKYASMLFDSSGRDWIIWTPSGYYDASSEGEKLLSWMPASAEDLFPGMFHVSAFRRQFRKPELVDATLLCRDESEALKRLKAGSGEKNELRRKTSLPAAIQLPFPGNFFTTKTAEIRLPYFQTPGRLPLKKIRVMLNGKALPDYLPDGKDILTVPVEEGDGILELIPVSAAGEGLKISCLVRRTSGR